MGRHTLDEDVDMISAHFLGFVALALAVGGLLAVLVVASRRRAMPKTRRSGADRVTIGYTAPDAPANADRRAAA